MGLVRTLGDVVGSADGHVVVGIEAVCGAPLYVGEGADIGLAHRKTKSEHDHLGELLPDHQVPRAKGVVAGEAVDDPFAGEVGDGLGVIVTGCDIP